MKSTLTLAILLLNTALSFSQLRTNFNLPDSLSSKRMEFVLDLKQEVANQAWESFGYKPVEGPFIYYNGATSELFFPNTTVLEKLDLPDTISDYIALPRLDQTPYHFELMVSFDSIDKSQYFYKNPVQQFIAVEEISEFISSVNSTEMWSSMVIHEMFHHFQYNQPAFLNYAINEIITADFDIRHLKKLCDEDPVFYKLIQDENSKLLEALAADDLDEKLRLASEFLDMQKARYLNYEKDFSQLEKIESYYILQEGSARYAEYHSLKIFQHRSSMDSANGPDQDLKFMNYGEFKDFGFEHPDFEYLIYPTTDTYHYAIGFNLMRLLDQLQINYKEEVFENPALGLSHFLK